MLTEAASILHRQARNGTGWRSQTPFLKAWVNQA
nr:hypothetical protein SFHH103_04384 [Sinorhizobium fredii HH103]